MDEKQFVVLEGLYNGNRFYSTNVRDDDPMLSAEGQVWYHILGYADTGDEARQIISRGVPNCHYDRFRTARLTHRFGLDDECIAVAVRLEQDWSPATVAAQFRITVEQVEAYRAEVIAKLTEVNSPEDASFLRGLQ